MRAGDRRIYVQIPAYRDPELLPTVADRLATAARPEQLVVRARSWSVSTSATFSSFAWERVNTRISRTTAIS
jgi:hypothetical protein